MTSFAKTVAFDGVECVHATDAALLCVIDGDEHWIPQSQVDDDSEVYEDGGEGTLIISEWIAIQKGLV